MSPSPTVGKNFPEFFFIFVILAFFACLSELDKAITNEIRYDIHLDNTLFYLFVGGLQL